MLICCGSHFAHVHVVCFLSACFFFPISTRPPLEEVEGAADEASKMEEVD